MLDYDGTIAPFRRNRHHALPYRGFSPLLQQIVRSGRTRVVIVSGRDAKEIIPLLDIEPRPELWGLHGLQRLSSDGNAELAPLDESTMEALAVAEDWLHEKNLQNAAEFKIGSVAVHWRGLGESEAETMRQRVLLGWKTVATQTNLHLVEFDGGVEIRAPEADKGDAVRTIMSEMDTATPAAYLGDDTTDEHAFEAMKERGLSILVRPRYRATAAQVWMKPPDEVLTFLERWLQACQPSGESNDGKNTLAVNA
jgi:trehalose-phosphatase